MNEHPWRVLPALVEALILTPDEAKGIVLAHENANRRALQEIHALLPELMHSGDISEKGHRKLVTVVTRAAQREMSDIG